MIQDNKKYDTSGLYDEDGNEFCRSEFYKPKKEATQVRETHILITGTVTNCKNLNVRKKPDQTSESIQIICAGSEVKIDKDKSTAEFYKVCTAGGTEGYCKKQFVKADAQ